MTDPIKTMIFLELLNVFFAPVLSQFSPGCDTVHTVNFNQNFYLNSPNYPNYYSPNTLCRWRFQSPQNSVMRLICSEIDIPATTNCQTNRFSVSLTGHPTLSDAQNYCGRSTLDTTSYGNLLTVGLKASNPGRFSCMVNALPSSGQQTTTTQRPGTNCDCGWRQQRRIIGGTETEQNEYVFMAALANRVGNLRLWCGSTIISERYAVTAAHCVLRRNADDYLLLVGIHKFSESRYDNAVLLDSFRIHQNYNENNQENDIAIIRTARNILFSLTVGPICLPYRYTNQDFTGAPVTLMGWGTTSFTGSLSDVLLETEVSVVSLSDCQSAFPNSAVTGGNICTYGNQRDACTYDSGGPVVWFDNFNTFRYQLVGIISWGLDCGIDAPAVNTRVPSYVSWILNSTREVQYCFK